MNSPRPFLICALPRSRTAWLANFLTHGRVQCAHELCSRIDGPEEIATALTAPSETIRFRGNSDSSHMLMLPELLERLPRVALVVIRRREHEVADSLARLGFPAARQSVRALTRYLDRAARTPGALVLDYAHLDEEPALRALLHHVAPGEPFDRDRWEMLRHLKIELTAARMQALLSEAEQIARVSFLQSIATN